MNWDYMCNRERVLNQCAECEAVGHQHCTKCGAMLCQIHVQMVQLYEHPSMVEYAAVAYCSGCVPQE